jgi:putative heme iron utilization protein
VTLEAAHLVAGFGRIHWLDAAAFAPPPPPAALVAAEPDIIAHMNADHGDALDAYANGLLGRAGRGWRMTGIDSEGCDLRHDGAVARIAFAQPVTDADSARAELVRLAKEARAATRS